jgi:hypothetical protein
MKKPFEEDLYEKVSINDLIVFSIYQVKEKKEKCTAERLIKECFVLFPRAFSFSQYPQWPDSRKIDRPLRSLRKDKMINGTPQADFSLTKEGEKRAGDLNKVFKQRKLI